MDSRSVAFLEVMLGLGAVGLLAFLILLVARAAQREPAANGRASPAWWGFLLAFLLTLVISVLLAIEFAPFGEEEIAEAPTATEEAVTEPAASAGAEEGTAEVASGDAAPTEPSEEGGAPPAEEPPATPATAEVGEDLPPTEAGETAASEAEVAEEPAAVAPQEPPDWRQGARGQAFYVVMLIVGGLALLGFLIVLFAQILPAHAAFASTESAPTTPAPKPDQPGAVETPSGARLIGLLLLAIMYLLLNWIYLERGDQHALLTNLVYPASLGVALVLLFDKATRVWSVKTGAETVREWLMCNGFAFLLLLGFLNLRGAPADETYASMFWDFLAIVLFFVAFWIVDRKVTAFRFLVGYAYLILLPVLLIIWRTTQGLVVAEDLSWWSTVWPVFFLSIIFFVLEVILLIASRDTPRHGIGALKDVVFVVLYAIALIAAIPPEVAA